MPNAATGRRRWLAAAAPPASATVLLQPGRPRAQAVRPRVPPSCAHCFRHLAPLQASPMAILKILRRRSRPFGLRQHPPPRCALRRVDRNPASPRATRLAELEDVGPTAAE